MSHPPTAVTYMCTPSAVVTPMWPLPQSQLYVSVWSFLLQLHPHRQPRCSYPHDNSPTQPTVVTPASASPCCSYTRVPTPSTVVTCALPSPSLPTAEQPRGRQCKFHWCNMFEQISYKFKNILFENNEMYIAKQK